MSLEENKAVIRRLYDAFSTGDLSAMEDVLAANAVDLARGEGQAPGVEGFKERITEFRTGFLDLSITIETIVAEGIRLQSTRSCAAPTPASFWASQRRASR